LPSTLFTERPYLKKYGLKEPPYSTKPNERYLYLTDQHRGAIAMVGRILMDREGAALVFGEFGTGKTTIMRRIYSELRDHKEYRIGVIENASHCPTEYQLAGTILDSFGEVSHHSDTKGRYDQIKQMLLNNYKQGIISVLLIDESHKLPARVLESLRGLLNFETSEAKIIQLVIFAQRPILKKLNYAKSFKNRLLKCELTRMSEAEFDEMLRWRFTQAGGVVFPFEAAAVNHLYTITKGLPRTALGIAQVSLEIAAAKDGRVSVPIIELAKETRFLD
jgi:general secretion pathway protein A